MVDLAASGAAYRWKDERFLGKVFDGRERAAIRRATAQDVVLWSLWACKEAAYKVVRKLEPEAGFVPHWFPVTLSPTEGSPKIHGRVETPFGPIAVRVETGEGFVHGLARWGGPPGWERIVYRILRVVPSERPASFPCAVPCPSMQLRSVLKEHLSERLGCGADRIEIVRRKGRSGLGPPMAYVAGERQDVDISMSHDGRFLAFACAGP